MTYLHAADSKPQTPKVKGGKRGTAPASQQPGMQPNTPPGHVKRSRPRPLALFSARREVGCLRGEVSAVPGTESPLERAPWERLL